ncbi:glycosyl transferase, partial [Francisella tularensis subsp. holarctica]|nr:glycosyl transferase [Francisella tularensis subsp. holarctica]
AITGICFISAISLFKILIISRCIQLISWFKYRFEK